MGLRVRPEPPAIRGRPALRVQLGPRVLRAYQVPPGQPVLLALLVPQVRLVQRVRRGRLEQLARKALPEHRVPPERPAQQEHRVTLDRRVRLA